MNHLEPLKSKNWIKSARLTTLAILILMSSLFLGFYYTDLLVLEKYGYLLSNRVIWSSDTKEKLVALTFDDGPNEKYTPELLDILQNKKAKATFFLIGKNVLEEPEIVRRIYSEGHEIGNHTYSHPVLPLVSRKEIHKQVEYTSSIIEDAIGIKPKYVRPPMGLFTPSVLDIIESNGLKTVVGDVYPRDPYMPGIDKIVRRIIKRVEPGSIIIMHDGGTWGKVDRSQTIGAVPLVIDELRENGYEFLTVTELLKMNSH